MIAAGFIAAGVLTLIGGSWLIERDRASAQVAVATAGVPIDAPPPAPASKPEIDTVAYDRGLRRLAHVDESATDTAGLRWPVKAAYPEVGALLPFRRIVAYYGNFSAKSMGVLGEYPEDVMLGMLKKEVTAWADADPATPPIPAIDYIAITAQGGPGEDGLYRLRMPSQQIDRAVEVAGKIDGIVILEVQAGKADLMGEIKMLEPYLSMPQVHLAIDPEFAMRASGAPPGTRVGTVDASQVNAAAEYLAGLVREKRLPPKVLIVHRYTGAMVTRASKIAPLPEVQILMDMDGWGPPEKKFSTYNAWIAPEPVQFTGFKLFYKNDVKNPGTKLLTPAEVLKLTPQPSFIQYQ